MTYKSESNVSGDHIDNPNNMRAAIRKNTQIRRQLSNVRTSLNHENDEVQQNLSKGSIRLVAKLNQLKLKATLARTSETSASHQATTHSKKLTSQRSKEQLENRSKGNRNRLYRQSTMTTIASEEELAAEKISDSNLSVRGPACRGSPPDLAKYTLPSWKRAELISKKQDEEAKNRKIYGKKRG